MTVRDGAEDPWGMREEVTLFTPHVTVTSKFSPFVAGYVSPDIFSYDGYFASHDFYNSPVPISFNKQLVWTDSLLVVSNKSKLVPTIFSTNTKFVKTIIFQPL